MSGIRDRIVGWVTLKVGGWYLRKRARELAPAVGAVAAVTGIVALALGAWAVQRRRAGLPTV
ncbi:MAG TPA: hypothetical protein VMT10_10760 [Solirubrobacteraceae bacterium]|nr:hypothetical protein [Solirubrobacteraceae bacterium]